MPLKKDNFDARVLAHVNMIRRIGRKRLSRRNEVDDFQQEVLSRVYAKRQELEGVNDLSIFIWTIANNLARHWWRPCDLVCEDNPSDAPDTTPSPQKCVENAEQWEMLRRAMRSLSQGDRELLEAHYFKGKGYAELERRLGISHSALASRLHEARNRLKKRFEAFDAQ